MGIALSFIEIIGCITIYDLFNEKRVFQNIIRNSLIALLSAAVFGIINRIGIESGIAMSVVLIIIASLLAIEEKKNVFEVIILILSSVILVSIAEIFASLIIFKVVNDNEINELYLLPVVISIMAAVITVVNISIKKYNFNVGSIINRNSNFNIILANGFIFILVFKLLADNGLIIRKILIQIIAIVLILIILNVSYLFYENKKQRLNKKIEIKDNINPLIDELLENLRASEHEYKNHLNILYCMMQIGDETEIRERAKNYIGNVMGEKTYIAEIAEIENIIVRAMLLSKIQEAEKNNVYCDFEVESKLDKIQLDDSELTVVISNLLNNAIEAAKESVEKEVLIYIGESKDRSIIRVSNSVQEMDSIDTAQIFTRGYSTKGEKRGYGMYNIKEIVTKHKGNVNIYKEEKMINIEVVI